MTIKATLPGGDPDDQPQGNYVMGHQSDGIGDPQQGKLFDDDSFVRPKLRDVPAHDPQQAGAFDRVNQNIEASARARIARQGSDDDGYDAMRDKWTGEGHDWKYSRPSGRRGR